jgi:hypothetical protein
MNLPPDIVAEEVRCMRIRCMLLLAVMALAVGANLSAGACTSCFDPPGNPWIRFTLRLENILFTQKSDALSQLSEPGKEEMVLVLQVTYLGSCPNCAVTYVKYLPGLDVDSDKPLTVTIDEVVFTLAECWPPSPISVRAAIWEDDMTGSDAVWELVQKVSRGGVTVQSGDPKQHPAEPWSVGLAGAFFDQLRARLNCCGNDVVMPPTRWEYDHSPIRSHWGWHVRWVYPKSTLGCWGLYPSKDEMSVIFCFRSVYDEPPGVNCQAQEKPPAPEPSPNPIEITPPKEGG